MTDRRKMNYENNFSASAKEMLIASLKKAKEGSIDALEELKAKYHPLIESQVNRCFADYMSNQDREDLYDEAISALCDAICSYNCENAPVEFGLYAKVCISNRLITFVRRYNARISCEVTSLDELPEFAVKDEQADPSQLVIEEEKIKELVGVIRKNLSPYEAKIWWMYSSGMSAKEIAAVVSEDARSVSNAVYRTRKKLKQALAKDLSR